MASPEEVAVLSSERMTLARIKVLLDHPYLASVLLRLPMRGIEDGGNLEAIATDGRRIIYRAEAVASLSTPEVSRLLLHVLLHVVLQHPERGGSRRWDAWNHACDFAVNAILHRAGVTLPKDWPYAAALAPLTAEAIYARLMTGAALDMPGTATSPTGTVMPPADPSHDPIARAGVVGHRDFLRAAEGLESPATCEISRIAEECRRGLTKELRERGRGTMPGDAVEEVDAAGSSRIDWRRVLARFLRAGHDRSMSMLRPNQKHLWRGIRLPGVERRGVGRIAVAIDTSASMQTKDLAKFIAEVDAIRRSAADELAVMQFDAAIQAVADFAPWMPMDPRFGTTSCMTIYGRGGTDLRVPFRWAEKERAQRRAPSALIVCTDGGGPLPSVRSDWLPTLFVVTPVHDPIPESLGPTIVL